jgi:hypothetical protein
MSSRSIRRILGATLLGAAGLCSVPAWAGKAHEHGAVSLDVAVEAGEVSLALVAPLDSLVGFERAPRTAAERRAADAALQRLREGATLFRLDEAAQCVLSEVQIEAPMLGASASGAEQPGERSSTRAASGHAHDEHAELEAHYRFSCARAGLLAALDVRLFEPFRRITRIDVQAVLPQKQRKAVLRRGSSRLDLRG